ncbi:major capsid protein [Staphylococcus hyicus]|uniref:major capsid protein n=1 Tax=Staphylococcus hyicus TaxID=1284 RepID=UPI00211C03DC|nr:major capsid protein [Staphylococcus hyicus]MCQ9290699.1 major capsid protein [Staphylococcus hyicus]MCQ9305941.1 major capsid protein [Staphylococcus hyicus]MCQ9308353.1 major capsid protein [Staphylococcus hyicus]MCQ9310775.1 major capsid protein [Staphylococcus hyicus]
MVLEDTRLQKPSLQAFISESDAIRNEDGSNAERYPLANAYPVEPVDEINNVYEIIESQIQAAAVITGFNSGSPIRSKGQGKQAVAQLTKIQNAHFLDEVEIYHYLNPRTAAERQRIVDNVLLSTNDLSVSVDDVKEYIRAQMAYNGKFDYADPMTQTRLTFNLDRPKENDVKAAIPWGQPESTPISDLQSAIKQFQKTNGRRKPEVINMSSATYEKLTRSGQIKNELFGDSKSPRIVSNDMVNQLLNSFRLPLIQIDDNETTVENEDGTFKTHRHLEDDKVVLRAAILGSTMSGPSIENNFEVGKFVEVVISQDPHTEKTIVGEVVMPVTKNINGTVFLSVGQAEEEDSHDDLEGHSHSHLEPSSS